jgi:hypothetical protein
VCRRFDVVLPTNLIPHLPSYAREPESVVPYSQPYSHSYTKYGPPTLDASGFAKTRGMDELLLEWKSRFLILTIGSRWTNKVAVETRYLRIFSIQLTKYRIFNRSTWNNITYSVNCFK